MKGYVLKPEAQERVDLFLLDWGNRGCTCFRNPPCSWCTHEDNPLNVAEEEGVWEHELVAAVREATTNDS